MDFFAELGARVAAHWSALDHDAAAFADVAAEALAERPPCEHVDWLEILRQFQRLDRLPAQRPFDPDWGHPSLAVFTAPRFYIEALFWAEGTTAIHQHAFSGAFHLLEGSSLQTAYRFDEQLRAGAGFRLGQLHALSTELLGRGATRAIRAGGQLIHSVFHLDRPSVSLVVRTYREEAALPQLTFRRPHLAFDPFDETCDHRRLGQSLELVRESRPLDHLAMLSELFPRLELAATHRVLEHCQRVFGAGERFAKMLAKARERHGESADRLAAVLIADRREQELLALRRTIADPGQRFFLALQLMVDDPARREALVAERLPAINAREQLAAWGAALSLPAAH